MKNIFLLFLIIQSIHSSAQREDRIWCFGDSAGIDFNDLNNPHPITSAVRSRGSCCSIANSSGNLLFYANTRAGLIGNTTLVWNYQNEIMENGDSIVGEGWYKELTIIPFPNIKLMYYLFSVGVTNSGDEGLYYSVIDMNQNNGLGKVTQKNIQLQHFACDDGLTAIKHGNGRDWWIIFRSNYYHTDTFFSYLIDPSGISNFTIQKTGHFNIGYKKALNFNSDGSKVIAYNYGGLIESFDFDRCTGQLSNSKVLATELEVPYLINVAYSPNDSLLYGTTNTQSMDTSYLFQFNLTDTNILLTKDTIHTYIYPPSIYEAGFLKLGPDKKIYVTNAYYNGHQNFYPFADSMYNNINMNIGVINNPNALDIACNYIPYSFNLGGKRAYVGLPNNPDYTLGPVIGSICDTISVNTLEPEFLKPELNVYYQSGWKTVFINAQKLTGRNFNLNVFDINGRLLFHEQGNLTSTYFTKNLNGETFANGIYFVSLSTEKEKLVKQFIKVQGQ